MKATELDEKFDNNEDISSYYDLTTIQQPGLEIKRVNVDMPAWMVGQLETESKKLGVTRQAIIKVWLADKLNEIMLTKKSV